jgi:hypothetical protein
MLDIVAIPISYWLSLYTLIEQVHLITEIWRRWKIVKSRECQYLLPPSRVVHIKTQLLPDILSLTLRVCYVIDLRTRNGCVARQGANCSVPWHFQAVSHVCSASFARCLTSPQVTWYDTHCSGVKELAR